MRGIVFVVTWLGAFESLCAATIIIGGSVQNGNFESGGYWAGPTGWDHEYITDPASAFEGTRFLEASTAAQRFFIYPEDGLVFELSFYAREGAMPLDELAVSLTSPYTTKVPELVYGEMPKPSATWQRYTATFVFDQPWSEKETVWNVRFNFLHEGTGTPGQIDAVTLRQVPEPRSILTLLCGSFVLWKRRRLSNPLSKPKNVNGTL